MRLNSNVILQKNVQILQQRQFISYSKSPLEDSLSLPFDPRPDLRGKTKAKSRQQRSFTLFVSCHSCPFVRSLDRSFDACLVSLTLFIGLLSFSSSPSVLPFRLRAMGRKKQNWRKGEGTKYQNKVSLP